MAATSRRGAAALSRVLVRAGEAGRWVLGEEGHGKEWRRVMHVEVEDAERVWKAISASVAQASVTGVRDLGRFGVNSEVDAPLTIGERSATIRTIWHYAMPGAAPRLVSAFPKP